MDQIEPSWWAENGRLVARIALIAVLAAWCLWAVDWRKAWPVLAAGGWAPLVLIGIIAAAVWSLIWPVPATFFGTFTIRNGFWQPMVVGLLVGLILFCGWLQSRWTYAPPEFNLDEPAHTVHDASAHDHAHH